ncbi:MAG: hypothetical protein JO316_20695 [Abitibacteriaceae bacterium]|nr:hypothetical protein [Abditibacteriaceae bacterium]
MKLPNDKQATRSAAIAAVVAVSAGASIGYAVLLATDSDVVGIGTASALSHLVNNFVRNRLTKGNK